MGILGFLLAVGGLTLGATPAQVLQNPMCGAQYTWGGFLSTGILLDKSGKQVANAYSFNNNKQLAYDKSGKHPHIRALFQVCTIEYEKASNGEYHELHYGHLKLPDTDDCLAVTTDSPSCPPYYLSRMACPDSTSDDLYTSAGRPFNFFMNLTVGDEIRWLGTSIPLDGIYQETSPPPPRCRRGYVVNATSLQHGYNHDSYGEPNTSASNGYRVSLYCHDQDEPGTRFNTLNLVGIDVISDTKFSG